MSRSIYDYTINKPDDFIQFVSNDFFKKEGFQLINYKGEQLWKRGTGMVTAANYIKLQYGNGVIHIEAFIKSFGEQNLEGFYGAIPKSQLKSRVDTLVNLLNQPIAVPNGAPVPQPVGAVAQGGYGGGGQTSPDLSAQPGASGQLDSNGNPVPSNGQYTAPTPIPVAVHNPTGQATLALAMGIVSIVMMWIPLIGVITGGIGIAAGRSGRTSTKKSMGTAGFVMSIIGMVLSLLLWLGNIILSVLVAAS